MRSTAPPLKRPSGLASATVPVTVDPAGTTTCPLTVTGSTTVPEKESPELFLLELSVSPSRIVMCSPAGTVVVAAAVLPDPGRVPSAGVALGAAAPLPGVVVAGCSVEGLLPH